MALPLSIADETGKPRLLSGKRMKVSSWLGPAGTSTFFAIITTLSSKKVNFSIILNEMPEIICPVSDFWWIRFA